jgi:hypothetical protein
MTVNLLDNSDIHVIVFNQKLFILQPSHSWHWFTCYLTFQSYTLSLL